MHSFAKSTHQDRLFEGVQLGVLSEVKQALNDGADINMRGPGGQTALMMSVLLGKHNIASYLLKKRKADSSIGENDGYTPIHGASFQGRHNIAKMLIEHGLDPREGHEDGFEPIARACWGKEQRHAQTLQVFLDAGAIYIQYTNNTLYIFFC